MRHPNDIEEQQENCFKQLLTESATRGDAVVVDATSTTVLTNLRKEQQERREQAILHRLENVNLRDEIEARRPTKTYVSTDWNGRIALFPMHAKLYIRFVKVVKEHFATNPQGTVTLTPGFPLNHAEWKREWYKVFEKRVNLAGNTIPCEPRDGEWNLRRDKQAIEMHLKHRIRPTVCTRLVRRRCADILCQTEDS